MKAQERLRRLTAHSWLPGLLCAAAGVVYLLQAVRYAHGMDVTMDEGTYLMKGLLYVQGVYRPFQEYGPITNKMPLSFYIPGAVQLLFGPGLRTGRYFSIFLGLLMLAALGLAGKRLAGPWGAAAAVWATAASPTNIMYYTAAISQVLTACLLAWSLALSLGRSRPLWQLVAGSVLAALTVLVRQNMAPVVPLLLLYIFWENGWRKSLWATLTAALILGFFHLIYWPGIMALWAPYLSAVNLLLPHLASNPLGGGASISQQSYDVLTKWFVFWDGARSNFPVLVGVVITWILWPARARWKSDTRFKVAVFLSLLFAILLGLHLWASIGQSYCLFCYSGYLAFFNMTGLLLVIVALSSWNKKPGFVQTILAVAFVLASTVGLGYGAYQQLGGLLTLRVPRISNMQLQGGTTDLWRLLANKFGWSYDTLQKLMPAAAGAAAGIALLVFVLIFTLARRRQQPGRISATYGYFALLLFFIVGTLLSPTGWMAGWRTLDLCGGDVIASHEAVGAHLAKLIPPGSLVYWENDVSPLPLLYIPGVRVFPAQLNHWYTYLQGGDIEALERLGYWNYELAQRWKQQADFLLVAERYVANWSPDPSSAAQFDELTPAPQTVPCRDRSIIHIFRRIR